MFALGSVYPCWLWGAGTARLLRSPNAVLLNFLLLLGILMLMIMGFQFYVTLKIEHWQFCPRAAVVNQGVEFRPQIWTRNIDLSIANNKLPWLGLEPKLLRMWVRQQTNWAIDELKVGDNLTVNAVQVFSRWLAQPSCDDFTPPTHSQHSGCIYSFYCLRAPRATQNVVCIGFLLGEGMAFWQSERGAWGKEGWEPLF